jgi:rhodanese-related sulfurtransferase
MRLKIYALAAINTAIFVCAVGCRNVGESTPLTTELKAEYRKKIEEINCKTGARQMEVLDLMERLYSGDSLLILDVRTPEEFQIGSLAGAISLPLEKVPEFTPRFYDNKTIVSYCTVGYRSGLAAVELEALLGRPVYNLDGGIIEWFNQGGEVVDLEGSPSLRIHPYNSNWKPFVIGRE